MTSDAIDEMLGIVLDDSFGRVYDCAVMETKAGFKSDGWPAALKQETILTIYEAIKAAGYEIKRQTDDQ